MGLPTYEAIASIELTSTASSVTFSSLDSIAAGFRDLVLVMQATTTASTNLWYTCNGDTGNNYNMLRFSSSGSTITGGYNTSYPFVLFTERGYPDASQPTVVEFNFLDFATTDKHKNALISTNAYINGMDRVIGRWGSTSAITSITIQGNNAFQSGSRFELFGIEA